MTPHSRAWVPWRCRSTASTAIGSRLKRQLDRPETRRETLVRFAPAQQEQPHEPDDQSERHRGQRRKREQDGAADCFDTPARRLHAVVAIAEEHGPAFLVGREHATGCDIQLSAKQRVRHGNVSLGKSEDRTHHERIAIGYEARAACHPRQRAHQLVSRAFRMVIPGVPRQHTCRRDVLWLGRRLDVALQIAGRRAPRGDSRADGRVGRVHEHDPTRIAGSGVAIGGDEPVDAPAVTEDAGSPPASRRQCPSRSRR